MSYPTDPTPAYQRRSVRWFSAIGVGMVAFGYELTGMIGQSVGVPHNTDQMYVVGVTLILVGLVLMLIAAAYGMWYLQQIYNALVSSVALAAVVQIETSLDASLLAGASWIVIFSYTEAAFLVVTGIVLTLRLTRRPRQRITGNDATAS